MCKRKNKTAFDSEAGLVRNTLQSRLVVTSFKPGPRFLSLAIPKTAATTVKVRKSY